MIVTPGFPLGSSPQGLEDKAVHQQPWFIVGDYTLLPSSLASARSGKQILINHKHISLPYIPLQYI